MTSRPVLELSQYFRYGNNAREGLQSKSTFDAMLAGERTATTRFPMWYRGGGLDQIKRLEPGQLVEFRDTKDRVAGTRRVLAEILPTKLSQQQMEMALSGQYPELVGLNGATYAISKRKLESDPKWLDRWSQLEGWSPQAGLDFFAKEPTGVGYQFQYKLVDG